MSIYNKLYSWQKKIVDKYKDRQAYGLFLDMGLGKTPISLAFAEQNLCTKILIITINGKATETVNNKGSWFDWLAKANIPYRQSNKHNYDFDNICCDAFVINYEALYERGSHKKERITLKTSIQNFVQSCKGHNVALIVDESHRTKNLQSLQTNAIIKIKKELNAKAKSVYTYLLTGTPFTTGYIDLYTQLKLLGCEWTKGAFTDMFCERGNLPGLFGWQQPIVGYKNLPDLYRLIHKYAITIKSDDVVDLPEQIFVNHVVDKSDDFDMFTFEKVKGRKIVDFIKWHAIQIDNETYKLYQIDKAETTHYDKYLPNPFFRNIAFPSQKWIAETSGQFWLRARELSIGFNGNASEAIWYNKTRLNMLKAFLSNNEDNYLLFYNYTPELLELYNICEELNYNIDVYCGEVKSLIHYEKFCQLSDSDKLTTKKNIILANFASGSTGLNWQEYNKCIIFSCPLFKDYEQGIKRIHRLGQKQTTIYHVFYEDNWLDKSMNEALAKQQDYSFKMFESDLRRIQDVIKDNE